jgi:hypothetical protein
MDRVSYLSERHSVAEPVIGSIYCDLLCLGVRIG